MRLSGSIDKSFRRWNTLSKPIRKRPFPDPFWNDDYFFGLFDNVSDVTDLILNNIDSEIAEVMKRLQYGQLKEDIQVQPIDKEGVKGFIAFGSFSTLGNQSPMLDKSLAKVEKELLEAREPLVDVFQRGNEVIVVAEVPGVAKEDIKLDATESILEIKVTDQFYRRIELPVKVDFQKARVMCKNGVLEVRLPKAGS